MAEGNTHIASQFVEDVISGQSRADVSMLTFRDRDFFVAGNLHNHFPAWERIANIAPIDLRPRFCFGSRTVLTCKISFNPLKVNIGEKTLSRLSPASDFF